MNEMKKEENPFVVQRAIIEKWLFLNVFISFACLLLLGERWIIGYHAPLIIIELISIPVNIEFVVPLLTLAYLTSVICGRIKGISAKLTKKRVAGVIISLVMCLWIIYLFYGSRGTGLLADFSKYQSNNKYYISFGSLDLKCTENEYNLIQEDHEYIIQFSFNRLFPSKGRLELIKKFE